MKLCQWRYLGNFPFYHFNHFSFTCMCIFNKNRPNVLLNILGQTIVRNWSSAWVPQKSSLSPISNQSLYLTMINVFIQQCFWRHTGLKRFPKYLVFVIIEWLFGNENVHVCQMKIASIKNYKRSPAISDFNMDYKT